jgi:hypothetical protein
MKANSGCSIEAVREQELGAPAKTGARALSKKWPRRPWVGRQLEGTKLSGAPSRSYNVLLFR